jgi:hypothetical protein
MPIAIRLWVAVWMTSVVSSRIAWAADNPRPELPAAKPAEKKSEPKDAAQEDLAAMQGTWTYEYKNQAGAVFRVEKAVVDDRDTVSHFDQQGNLIHSHVSDVELVREGPLRLFKILNSTVTAGPDTGKQHGAPRAFCYRIEGDKMIEVWGLLETDRGGPRVIVWDRVKK